MRSSIKRAPVVFLMLALLAPTSAATTSPGTPAAAHAGPAEVTAERGPSLKWCKRHKKKCRRALRRHAKPPRKIVRARIQNYRFNPKGRKTKLLGGYTVYENPEDGEQAVTGGGAGTDPAFWKRNGAGPGRAKGCRQVIGYSEDWGRWGPLIFKFRKYRYASRKFWCWRNGRVLPRSVSKSEFVDETDDFIRPVRHFFSESRMYRWRDRKGGGHFHEARAEFEACVGLIVTFCPTAHFYPYIRIYAHGDGSYHMSGHDF